MMIIFWVLIIIAVYYLIKDDRNDNQKKTAKRNAVEVLKLRFINGEIDQETYRRTLEVMKNSGGVKNDVWKWF